MKKSRITARLIILVAAFIFGCLFSAPSFLGMNWGAKVNLGLDLQGGLYMLLGVDTKEAVANKIQSISSGINYFTASNDILIDDLEYTADFLTFELLDLNAKKDLDGYLSSISGISVKQNDKTYTIFLKQAEIQAIKTSALLQSVETIRNRLDQFGLSEPTVMKQGDDKILVEIPGIKTKEDERRARDLIGKTAHLVMMAVDEDKDPLALNITNQEAQKFGDVILTDVYNKDKKFVLKKIPVLDGSKLVDARVGYDQNNRPIINFKLDSQGAKIFGDFTGKSVGKRLAIVLDGRVYSAPVINERIGGGSGQISGHFTTKEASDLAIALRSGSLSAKVTLLEKRSIGPSLGKDSIKKSIISLIGSFLAVALFMIFYYGYSGVISDIALLANLLILIGVMAIFGATLTLPGMVGIVLTIGMAVDSNVIIVERIKELLNEGKSVQQAIEKGYENAFSAILDSNITTIMAAVALYAYGTGPIKGFALTLSIGILTSMLTAIVGTRGIYDLLSYRIKDNKKSWFGFKEQK